MKNIQRMSDDELVKSFMSGQEDCLHVLMSRHKNKIYSYILMMVKQQELAEDVFQDTFIKVLQNLKRGKYVENGRFPSWVMRIAHNLIIDFYRKQKHMQVVSNDANNYDLLNSAKYSEANVEDKMVYSQVLTEVVELLEQLPDKQKEVVRLRHFMGLSFKEIAEETGVSINTALGRMRYALINMRAMVEEKNISLTI
ncbi:RNA polymerase sigma factor [Saccharicrinis fermentans]|uniref:RNA polymerase sigma factor SigV n=1 Tax=Saccharicrinis fermentans DSM 9555 = JCM 21142 TaxID=869213 RepID=W7Y463_9BACT|nr:sigma-70 family RNA polymerase sigma factor [Saccharicrinis fermentans]GAF02363.1 RNA polymerase sigma factor SigV [Saccharicrinis fermentans DSM 9555 = JCM 21142]